MFARISSVVLVGFLFVALGGVFQATAAQTEENKAIARRFWEEGWKKGNQTVFDEICATDFVNHDPTLPEIIDLEAYKQHVALHATALPTLVGIDVEDMVAQGDKVAVRWTWRVTHEGEYMGIPPTGNQVTMTGITIHRFTDGKVAENWHNYDALGLLQQLGVVPTERVDFTWGTPSEVTGDPGDPAANKEILRRALDDFWNQGDVGAIDELYATDYLGHDPSGLYGATVEEFKQSAAGIFTAFPDFHLTIDDEVAEGNKVVKRWTVTGTHQGELMGVPATGNQVVWTGMTVARFADGKIVEAWWAYDVLGIMQQLGVIPPLGTAVESRTWGQVKSLFK